VPLTGEYGPGPFGVGRDQVELYERTGGTQGTTTRGRPVIVLTSVGARTGNLRKALLMRVEHDGRYAVVASLGGAPSHPVWYHNLIAQPPVELQDGPVKKDYEATEVHGGPRRSTEVHGGPRRGVHGLVRPRCRDLAGLRRVPEENHPEDADLRPHASSGVGARSDESIAPGPAELVSAAGPRPWGCDLRSGCEGRSARGVVGGGGEST
jgi:deazaflavin-dependent oxidoreductase (nitroreductase family)